MRDATEAVFSGRRSLTKDFPFRVQPIGQCGPFPIAPLGMEFIGALRDQALQVRMVRQRRRHLWRYRLDGGGVSP